MKTLQLINAPLSKRYSKSIRTGVYPPLNIATIAGYLMKVVPNIEIELFDGEIQEFDDISSSMNSGIIGISCNIMTYESAMNLCRIAKSKGAVVVLGGPYPTIKGKEILKTREFVDIVVVGDGELPILEIVLGKKLSEIKNIIYRKNKQIITNPKNAPKLDMQILPDYSSLPIETYFSNFRKRYLPYKPFHASLPIYSSKGCKWRNSHGGCSFCMIPNKCFVSKQVQHYFNELLYFNELYGVDSFWEVSDSFTDNMNFIRQLSDINILSDKISLHIYSRASKLQNMEIVKSLKTLGVFEVFIGAESGDDKLLELLNKGVTTFQIQKAVENLERVGIKVTLSFVLGLQGESRKTLYKTLKFAENLSKYSNVIETSTNILQPIPGSRVYQMLSQKDKTADYNYDFIDLEILKNNWIEHFTTVTHKELDETKNIIESMFPLNHLHNNHLLSAPHC